MTANRHKSLLKHLPLAILFSWISCVHAEHYTIPLLVPATTSDAPQGVLRILNGTTESGTVDIYAIDDSGMRSGPATFTLNASAAVEFTATDLASGNAILGLTGGIGTDVGDARVEIETELKIVPLAFTKAVDGTLSTMHDTVRTASYDESGPYIYGVPVFNPSTDMTQVSRLRLINPDDAAAAVKITALDDSGADATGGEVTLTLAAGGAKTLTAQQLEAGDMDVTGQLGAGTGKWRLTVSSDQPLEVVNIVASTTGYWNNVSTTAVPGFAPADQAGLNERIVGNSVIYETSSGRSTLEPEDGGRFTETTQADGLTVTHMGEYNYAAIGPDAGRLALDYSDGDVCRANLYFSSRTSGWFASHCTGTEDPDGYWSGGSWFVERDGDGGAGDPVETTYGVNDALPGVPMSGSFVPASTGGGIEVTDTPDGTTITLDNDGYFDLDDGTRYTCTAVVGCRIVNGTVTAGTVAGRAAGTGEVDRFPSFRTTTGPGNQTYTVGMAIDTLTLPEASGGNGNLTYSLSPSVPGLAFNSTTRQLTGTPSTASTYAMTYTVTDEDGDTDTLSFDISVSDETTENGDGQPTPSVMVARGSSFRVALDWSAPVFDDGAELTGYTLHRGDGNTCDNLAVIQEGLASDLLYAEDNTVSTGATYCYRLTANGSMDAELDSNDAVVRAVAPAMPTALQVTASSASMIGLSWTAPPDDGGGPPYGYNVYRCQGADCRFEGETWLAWVTDGTSYTDDGNGTRPLFAEAMYRYAVATSRAGEISVWSNWVTANPAEAGSLGDCYVGLLVSMRQSCTYPGTSDEFSVNVRGRGQFLDRLAGIRISISNETINGRVYDFVASHQGDGVWRIDRIAGSTVPPADTGTGNGTDNGTDTGTNADLTPSFPAGAGPGNQTYTVGTAIDTLTLPAASGGDGTLTYSLSPTVSGLTFNATARQVTGTPTTAASYNMTYTATDDDGDTDTLTFTITVEESDDDGDDALSGENGSDDPLTVWRGVDLSYVNEMEDCGAVYSVNGAIRDPYEILAEAGANLVRLRLWHTPEWTNYSTLADVTRSIRRAKALGLAVLLDFHYSDDWADPTTQVIPAAWSQIGTTQDLAQALYDYTYSVLSNLDSQGLAPDYVQIGNEINTAILQPDEASSTNEIDWSRTAELLNAGIRAVRDFAVQGGTNPGIMLHVAGPENVGWWFDAATAAGVIDFDIIGFSYYSAWSNVRLIYIDETIAWMRNRYDKDIVIAESAYPWTLSGNDSANNLGGQEWLVDGYLASTDGQRQYNIDLMQAALDGGGLGIIYWEPAWISTQCSTRWGQGSHWENLTFFDYERSELHEGGDFLSHEYR